MAQPFNVQTPASEASQSAKSIPIAELIGSSRIQRAFAFINDAERGIDDELIRICEIPAPPFREQDRAAYVERRFTELGLSGVRVDQEGNVIAGRPGLDSEPRVIVSAHLDTVFPEGTDVRVRRDGSRLHAPGISDNACGVLSLIALAQALDAG